MLSGGIVHPSHCGESGGVRAPGSAFPLHSGPCACFVLRGERCQKPLGFKSRQHFFRWDVWTGPRTLFHWEDRSKLNEVPSCPLQSIKRALLGAGQRRREKAES